MPTKPTSTLLLQHLSEMRAEQREDHQLLVAKVDEGFQAVAQQSHLHALDDAKQFAQLAGRITPLESTHRSLKWAVRSVVGAFIVFVFDLLVNHAPRMFTHTTP